MPILFWMNLTLTSLTLSLFYNLPTANSLAQGIDKSTRNTDSTANLIDHMRTRRTKYVIRTYSIPCPNSDHNLIVWSLRLNPRIEKSTCTVTKETNIRRIIINAEKKTSRDRW